MGNREFLPPPLQTVSFFSFQKNYHNVTHEFSVPRDGYLKTSLRTEANLFVIQLLLHLSTASTLEHLTKKKSP